jgi:hypothetical protein
VEQPRIQAALLERWDNPKPRPEGEMRSTFHVEVHKLLFVCGADLPHLEGELSRLGRHAEQPISAEALIAVGAKPEFARRFETIVNVPPLDEVSMSRIVRGVDWSRLSPPQEATA